MPAWPSLPLEEWRETCDTLHAHTQLLGKLCVALAPPEPQLQHAALHLSTRGWQTLPLPAPDGSGALGAVLDMQVHEAVLEHSDGRSARVSLLDASVGAVTRELLVAAHEMVGEFAIDLRPQEVPWTAPLDEDEEHRVYDPDQAARWFAAATRAGLVLGDFRAPFRGRSTPVNAWWGSFDLAVSLFSGRDAEPPSKDFIMRNSMDAQEVAVGWWPGDDRYERAAFYAYAHPSPDGFGGRPLAAGRWQEELGEYVLDWDDVIGAQDPHATALGFAHEVFRHACTVCDWDPALAASAEGTPPPVA
ncbi:MAG TPA: DUF5996 family protein [Solirubrobacteraceae bacterium]|nr:DUF5996 family protein [Solirubrobacteraceae bacterium]